MSARAKAVLFAQPINFIVLEATLAHHEMSHQFKDKASKMTCIDGRYLRDKFITFYSHSHCPGICYLAGTYHKIRLTGEQLS